MQKQLGIGRAWFASQGIECLGEFSDNDRSASRHARRGREDWEELVEQIATGAGDVLWALEISRHTRDLVVWAQLAAVCREHSMWIALDDELWDTTKPSHMKHLNSLMVDAVYEADMTQHRIAQDLEVSARAGRPHSPVGWGFKREYDPDTGVLLRQVVDVGSVGAIERARMAEMFLEGTGQEAIAADLNNREVRTPSGYLRGELMYKKDGSPLLDPNGNHRRSRGWTGEQVKKQLLTPTIAGMRGYNGEVIEEGGWEHIVPPEDWWEIRSRLEEGKGSDPDRRPHDAAARYLASGIAKCGPCGGYMGTCKRVSHGRDVGRRYRCDPKGRFEAPQHVSRRVEVLDEQIEALVVAEFSAPDVLERFAGPSKPEEIKQAKRVLEKLRAELNTLYRQVEQGDEDWTARMAKAEERRLLAQIAKAEKASRPRRADPMAEMLASPDPALVLATWRGWTLEQQRTALRLFTQEIRVLPLMGRRRVSPEESVSIRWVGEKA